MLLGSDCLQRVCLRERYYLPILTVWELTLVLSRLLVIIGGIGVTHLLLFIFADLVVRQLATCYYERYQHQALRACK